MPGNIIIELWKLEWLAEPDHLPQDISDLSSSLTLNIQSGPTSHSLRLKYSSKQIPIKDSLFFNYKQLTPLKMTITSTLHQTPLVTILDEIAEYSKKKGPTPVKLIFTRPGEDIKKARLYADIEIIDNQQAQPTEQPEPVYYVLDSIRLNLTDKSIRKSGVSMFDFVSYTEGVAEQYGDMQIIRNNQKALSKIVVPSTYKDKAGNKLKTPKINFRLVSRKAGTRYLLLGVYEFKARPKETVYIETPLFNPQFPQNSSVGILHLSIRSCETLVKQNSLKSKGTLIVYSTTIKISSSQHLGKNRVRMTLGKQNKLCLINNSSTEEPSWIEKCEFRRNPSDTSLMIELSSLFNESKIGVAELTLYGHLDGTRYCSKCVPIYSAQAESGRSRSIIGQIRLDFRFEEEGSLQLPQIK